MKTDSQRVGETTLDLFERPIPAARSRMTLDLTSTVWFLRLRWCAALAQTAGIVVAGTFFAIDLAALPLVGCIALLCGSNLYLSRRSQLSRSLSRTAIESASLLDSFLLTVILFYTGGAANPFSIIYLVHIVLAAVVLGERWTWVMTVLSTTLYGFLFLAPSEHSPMHHTSGSFTHHLIGMWIAFAFTASLLAFFVNRILFALRLRDEEARALERQVAKTEQFAALVALSAGAAHELSTPLATIAIAADEIEGGLTSKRATDEQVADIRLIKSELERCKSILTSMSGNIRGEMPTTFTLAELRADLLQAAATLGLSEESFREKCLLTKMTLPRNALVQSLFNLIKNAADADPSRQIAVAVDVTPANVRFEISDRGPGIPKELIARLGEPFITTKPTGTGMGLGIFLVKTFAERMGGQLRFSSVPVSGTVASLSLPLHWRQT
ncbi:MAG: ATP-binding protein [Bdellovibrionota bacterium]